MISTKRKMQSEVVQSFFSVWKKMSPELKSDLAKQVAVNVRQYGQNLRITIPPTTSNEMHRLSNNLVVSGAISRTKGHIDTTGFRTDRDFTFVVHHEMADAMLKQCKEAVSYATDEASSRFKRSHKALHLMLWGALPQANGQAVIHIEDAVSVTKMSVTTRIESDGNVQPVEGYVLDRAALNLIRGIIAPFNQANAEVTLTFSVNDPSTIELDMNGTRLTA